MTKSSNFFKQKSLVKLLSKSRRMQNANIKSEDKTFDLKTGKLWVSRLLPIIFSPRRSSGMWNVELTSHYDLFV